MKFFPVCVRVGVLRRVGAGVTSGEDGTNCQRERRLELFERIE